MIALHIYGSGGKQYSCALGVGVFRHFVSTDPVEEIKNQLRIQDDWQETDLAKLPALLRTYGCDLNIWDVRNGDFAVLDPLDGTVKAGNVWTATGMIRAAIKGIEQPVIDPSPIVAAVEAAIAEGRDYDVDEIAAAVQDEADRRARARLEQNS